MSAELCSKNKPAPAAGYFALFAGGDQAGALVAQKLDECQSLRTSFAGESPINYIGASKEESLWKSLKDSRMAALLLVSDEKTKFRLKLKDLKH